MTTCVEQMKVLKATCENAPPGPEKEAAIKAYEMAQKDNVAKIEKAADAYLDKAVDALK
jgi:hypothetical protein